MANPVIGWHNKRVAEHHARHDAQARVGWRLVSLSLHGTGADRRITAVMVLEERLEPSPRWYEASAPAVILRGAGRSYRHGDDGRFDKDGLLRCRRGHEIISGVRYAIPGQNSALQVTPEDIVDPQITAFLPAAVRGLLGEAALRDPASAARIAQIKAPPPGVPPSYDGTLPPSFSLAAWTPLFCPLFAECAYTFTPAGGAPLPTIEERALLGTVLSASLSSALTRLDAILGQGLAYTQLAAAAETMFRLDLLSFTLPALQSALAAAGVGVREGELGITRARERLQSPGAHELVVADLDRLRRLKVYI